MYRPIWLKSLIFVGQKAVKKFFMWNCMARKKQYGAGQDNYSFDVCQIEKWEISFNCNGVETPKFPIFVCSLSNCRNINTQTLFLFQKNKRFSSNQHSHLDTRKIWNMYFVFEFKTLLHRLMHHV